MQAFELPIALNTEKVRTDENLIKDLGLQTKDTLYKYLMNNSNSIGNRTIQKWCEYFTTDTKFLKDTQQLVIKKYPPIDWNIHGSVQIWDDIKKYDSLNDNGNTFVTKYQYIEWGRLYFLNTNSWVLQWLSIYNMSSPVLSLIIPILLLFVPFIILRAKKMEINLASYMQVLKSTFAKHQLGKLFSLNSSADIQQRIYVAVSTGLYFLQIYQNIRACISFWKNMNTIHSKLKTIHTHICNTTRVMNTYLSSCKDLTTHLHFNKNLKEHIVILQEFEKELQSTTTKTVCFKNIGSVGKMMKCFYLLYRNEIYKKSLEYSFDFCGYITNIQGLRNNIETRFLGKCKYSKKHTSFKKAFYPVIKNPIKNSYNLRKHLLITGPNAAGKTTLLKTTIFNILLSQQFGYGCYKQARIVPYNYIHSYINIPDTSDRDSLFQAEARRCKNILTSIAKSGDKARHFCVFDELYSGTNPYEAIGSAASFLQYLATNKNISFIITTHFIGLCQRLSKNDYTKNCHMKTNENNEGLKYTYKLNDGISNVKGGVHVMRDLEYPSEIVDAAKRIIKEITL